MGIFALISASHEQSAGSRETSGSNYASGHELWYLIGREGEHGWSWIFTNGGGGGHMFTPVWGWPANMTHFRYIPPTHPQHQPSRGMGGGEVISGNKYPELLR